MVRYKNRKLSEKAANMSNKALKTFRKFVELLNIKK